MSSGQVQRAGPPQGPQAKGPANQKEHQGGGAVRLARRVCFVWRSAAASHEGLAPRTSCRCQPLVRGGGKGAGAGAVRARPPPNQVTL
jgi:hypothetical protein